jgi:inorganic pyrophosphatase
MHPWHDTHVDESTIATAFPVIVEIPKGSTNKYELDKDFRSVVPGRPEGLHY